MSDTDIYKKREQMPFSGQSPKRPRRRRRSSEKRRAFDDNARKRRSRNSGLRRLLHLYRKKESEKIFWWTVGIGLVVILVSLAVWQFGIQSYLIRQKEQKDDYRQYQQPALGLPANSGDNTNSAAE